MTLAGYIRPCLEAHLRINTCLLCLAGKFQPNTDGVTLPFTPNGLPKKIIDEQKTDFAVLKKRDDNTKTLMVQ